MNLIQITPGAGGMYCGNCFRDNALVAALRRQGHDTLMVPLYLPMTLDETSTVAQTPTFFGGINVFLDQKSALYRGAPSWLRQLLDSPALLKWAAGKTAKTRPDDVGELTVSMLQGEQGNQARDLDEMISWLRQQPHIDAVFLSNALLAGFARQLKQALDTKVVCFLQSEESFLDSLPDPWRVQAWSALKDRAADLDLWISPSRYFADRMIQRLGLPPGRVPVVPNGISLEGYDTLPPRVARRPGEPVTLGFFARMCPEKGLDTVVDAFIRLRQGGRMPNLRLKVGGGCGPSDEKFVAVLRQRLTAANLLADVSFHPNVSREEKVVFYAGCDVLSVPAKMSESFGLYVIEAMAAGTPLVQPDAITYPELITATGGGVLCGSNTADALADALEPLLLDPARLRALGDAGRASVFARYTDEVMAREIVRVTGSLLP